MGLYPKMLLATLLVSIGIGAVAPALLNLVPGTIAVSYSSQAVPKLMLVAAAGGALFVVGVWVAVAAIRTRKSN